MILRRVPAALTYVPLAVLVGLLAHVATFGFGHAPGAAHVWEISHVTAAALAAALFSALLAAALVPTGRDIAAAAGRRYRPLVLAVAGIGTFVLLEALEGHVGFAGLARAVAAALPIALGVARLARHASRAAERAGLRLALAVAASRRAVAVANASRDRSGVFARRDDARPSDRNRAPPLFA